MYMLTINKQYYMSSLLTFASIFFVCNAFFVLQSYGGVEFEVILLTDTRDLDQVCRGPVQGFKVLDHFLNPH